MSDSKIPIVTAYLEAAQRQDIPTMRAAFTDDFVYRVPGRGPLAGVSRGPDAAIAYFGAIMRLTGGTYAITEVVDWLESADRVALVAREQASRNGRMVEWTRIILFTFRGPLISSVSLFDDALYELDEMLVS